MTATKRKRSDLTEGEIDAMIAAHVAREEAKAERKRTFAAQVAAADAQMARTLQNRRNIAKGKGVGK